MSEAAHALFVGILSVLYTAGVVLVDGAVGGLVAALAFSGLALHSYWYILAGR